MNANVFINLVQLYCLPGVLYSAMMIWNWNRLPESARKQAAEFGGIPVLAFVLITLWPVVMIVSIKNNK